MQDSLPLRYSEKTVAVAFRRRLCLSSSPGHLLLSTFRRASGSLPLTITMTEKRISSCRAVVYTEEMCADSDEHANVLKGRADVLMADYAVSHALHIIEEAIFFYEQVLQLRPLGHERRHEATSDLGEALFFLCASHKADDARAHQSIELLREAVQLRPLNHPLRDRSLHNLARALFAIEYEQRSGDVNALTECIRLNHEVLQLRVIGHPKRVQSLGNLATALMTSFKRSGDPALLMECVRMDREAMQLLEPGHPLRTISLMNLANTLGELASFRGELEALAEADSLFREVLELRPPGHPLRFRVLDNLADSLLKRYELQALPAVLSEAIALQREAWGSFSADHPEWGKLMMNLAESLVAHFRHERDLSSITEAIALLRQSLLLLPSGHAYRHYSMDSLAEALLAQFEEYKDPTYLREAIAWNREVLELRPPGHTERPKSLQRLGRLLCKPEARHWPEALTLFHEAMESYPARHPSRSSLLSDISQCFLSPESPFFDLSKGISYLSEGYSDELSHVNQRLRHSVSDLRQVEAAYIEAMRNETVSVGDRYSSRILGLYVQIISLLPRAANFGLDHKTRLQVIAGSDEIARNATARALLLGRTSQAVELMEEGRGIFWSQTLHLRSTRFDCVPDSDREHFVRLLRMLEHGARTAESPDQTAVHREEALERRRRLNEELEVLITRIRTYPGSARFLMPASFASLLSGLPDGFVVVINASKLACHALLLHGATWLASNFELTPPSTGQGWMSLRSRLPRDIGAKPEQHDQMHRAMRLVSGQDTSLNTVFAQVWTSLVHPVICRLGLQRAIGRDRPRLWWCVTGELGFLPIHAAGNYEGTHSECTADYAVSSYIPTLSSLNKARSGWKPIARGSITGLLICETYADHGSAGHLPGANKEACFVRECFGSAQARVLNPHSSHTSLAELRVLLEDSPAHVLHLACHGVQDADPLSSALVMQDGRLTIEDMVQLDLPQAVLAYLSACQTAKGDQNAPDQAVHLASSMLFCGFRSVVATMWLMHDEDGPILARHFYEALFAKDALDLDDIAYALDEAVEGLRNQGVPAQRWALFMHMGG